MCGSGSIPTTALLFRVASLVRHAVATAGQVPVSNHMAVGAAASTACSTFKRSASTNMTQVAHVVLI